MLRQFAGLFLIVFLALAGWRVWRGHADQWAGVMAVAGLGVGLLGLIRPTAVRWVYTGWMVVAFPIGWTISNLVLALMFYGIFTPVSFVFRAIGRDELQLRKKPASSFWRPKPVPGAARDYFRQF